MSDSIELLLKVGGHDRRENAVDEDKEANNEALKDGSRLLSAYILPTGIKIWLLSESEDDHGNREATTALLPDEY